MIWADPARHAFFCLALGLVALLLEPFDHAVERPAAAIVENGLPIAVEDIRLRHVQADREYHAPGAQVEPVPGRGFLRAALPPPERLVVLIWLLVAREPDVAVDSLDAVVRPRIDLKTWAEPAELRAKLDNELPGRLEHLLLVLVAVLVEPFLAVVALERAQESGGAVRKGLRHRGKSSRYRIPSTFRAMVRSEAAVLDESSRLAGRSSSRMARSVCRSSSSAASTSRLARWRAVGPGRPRPIAPASAAARSRARARPSSSWASGRR